MKTAFLSVDVEEDVFSLPERTFRGVEELPNLLSLFKKLELPATLFVTGEVLERFPKEAQNWAQDFEIGLHSWGHEPLDELSPEAQKADLEKAIKTFEKVLGRKPKGFRAPQHRLPSGFLRLLQEAEFEFDASVMPHYPPGRKYAGYTDNAPLQPYFPDLGEGKKEGKQRDLVEIPCAGGALGLPLGGTWLRYLGVKTTKMSLWGKPNFISIAMHPWDAIPFAEPLGKNSGEEYLRILEEFLKEVKKKYKFKTGGEIASELKKSNF